MSCGQGWPPKPGVARMCSMLADHAARSAELCSGSSGTSWKPGPTSSSGTTKSAGTNGRSVTIASVPGPSSAPTSSWTGINPDRQAHHRRGDNRQQGSVDDAHLSCVRSPQARFSRDQEQRERDADCDETSAKN